MTVAGAGKMGAEKVAILNKLADLIDEHTAELAELEIGPDRHRHQAPP